MCGQGDEKTQDKGQLWSMIADRLRACGIDLDRTCCGSETDGPRVKVVCVAPGLSESVQEMGLSPRGQTVMVRLDEDTVQKLDAWVETAYVKSRSEAAALFIREGLKVRASELAELNSAVQGVRKAREQLRERARHVFGEEEAPPQA